MKRDKIQNTVIKFKDNNINNECYLDGCNDIKTKGNDNKNYKSNDDNNKRNNYKINIIMIIVIVIVIIVVIVVIVKKIKLIEVIKIVQIVVREEVLLVTPAPDKRS